MKRPPEDTPPLYAQDGKGYDAIVHAHYFIGGSDWLVTEYDPEQDLAFGWTCINGDRQMAELGYTSLTELEGIRVPLRVRDVSTGQVHRVGEVPVELEEGWTPVPLREAIALLDTRQGNGQEVD